MLSYRHAFHAGNHADVLKHSTLTLILSSLLKKNKPFTLFDTHGGAGLYELDYQGLIHTGESQKGVLKLVDYTQNNLPPEPLETYLNLAKEYVGRGLYPGSPEISRKMMRNQDKLFVAELHNTEIEVLRGNMEGQSTKRGKNRDNLASQVQGEPTINIRHESGFSMLHSCLPPQIKRGLILVDPSYETQRDYIEPIRTLSQAAKKWETAIIALWYPLLTHRQQELDNLLCQLEEGFSLACGHNGDRKVITAELCLAPIPEIQEESIQGDAFTATRDNQNKKEKLPSRLYGSGMMILNSPYQLDQQLSQILPYLVEALAPKKGSWEVRNWS